MSIFPNKNRYYLERNMKIIIEHDAGISVDELADKYGIERKQILLILKHSDAIRSKFQERQSKGYSRYSTWGHYDPTQLPLPEIPVIETEAPIHGWFGLNYCSYLVLPRSVLQSMPAAWQQQLVDLIEEAQRTLDIDDMPDYRVKAVNVDGKFVSDPYQDYQRGRRHIPKKQQEVNHANQN